MPKEKTIRELVVAEAKRQGLTGYGLWKLVEPQVTRQTIYDFLAGRTDMTTEKLAPLLKALRIRVLPPEEKSHRN